MYSSYHMTNLCSCFVQQDEDKDNPDERGDADSDVEMNDAKPLEDSGRYLFLLVSSTLMWL